MRIRVRRGRPLRSANDGIPEILLAGLAGLALGVLGTRWIASRPDPVSTDELGDPDERWVERWGDRMDAAVEAGARGIRDLRRRWRSAPPVDLPRVQGVLDSLEGCEGIGVHDLGNGIVELVGEAPQGAAVAAVAALEQVPGVRVALNRVWS